MKTAVGLLMLNMTQQGKSSAQGLAHIMFESERGCVGQQSQALAQVICLTFLLLSSRGLAAQCQLLLHTPKAALQGSALFLQLLHGQQLGIHLRTGVRPSVLGNPASSPTLPSLGQPYLGLEAKNLLAQLILLPPAAAYGIWLGFDPL